MGNKKKEELIYKMLFVKKTSIKIYSKDDDSKRKINVKGTCKSAFLFLGKNVIIKKNITIYLPKNREIENIYIKIGDDCLIDQLNIYIDVSNINICLGNDLIIGKNVKIFSTYSYLGNDFQLKNKFKNLNERYSGVNIYDNSI